MVPTLGASEIRSTLAIFIHSIIPEAMAPPSPGPIIILENGAHTIKCGVLPSSSPSSSYTEPRIIPNACVRPRTGASTLGTGSRWLIGHEISDALAHDVLDYAGMQYRLPFEKGFLTDWDAQKAVWDGLFSVSATPAKSKTTGPLTPNGIDTTSATLLVTEPYFNLPTMQDTYDQIVFEEYEFAACWRGVPAALVPHGSLFTEGSSSTSSAPKPQCTLIVDAGFSYTHVVPMVDGRVVWQAVKRCVLLLFLLFFFPFVSALPGLVFHLSNWCFILRSLSFGFPTLFLLSKMVPLPP
ncbi:hypothetical protein D9619_012665 [Psilocybe cf. subviscida]|uniref:Actin-like protein ARP6 n=1 Tax=Psilocybe cf. subviscida TaxID=2480587 RepID=A0A8H5EZ71_9AGAR|nr:hypothetical protein D9619_012665 [Psilocybe cf. subviscida]